MRDDAARRKALTTAANVLQYRHRSRAALINRLVEKGIDELDAEFAAGRLEELGLLDDLSYARGLAESYSARGYGRAYIKKALRAKLLEHDIIGEALQEYCPNESKMDSYIQAKMAGKAPDAKLIKKVTDGLFRRGFAWDEIKAAMARYTDLAEEEFFE